MLNRLYIANYALIDEMEIGFDDGLTILTGETGAGKSIILGALSLILGERAELRFIRDKSIKTVVEATFDLSNYELKDFFESNQIDYFEKECIARREISSTGRSRAFINDTPVTVAVLKELVTRLVDIHSQHSNMLLSSPRFQLSVLDHIAGNGELLTAYSKEFHKYQDLFHELESLKANFHKSRQEEDYIRFQLSQLAALELKENEDEELEALQRKLSNIAEIKENLWIVDSALNGEENSIIDQLTALSQRLSATENHLEDIAGMGGRIHSTVVELKDIAETIASIDSDLVDDPKQLEHINDRLNEIYSLEHKHNVASVNELLTLQHDLQGKISDIDNSEEHMKQKEAELKTQLALTTRLASQLSLERKKSAQEFIKKLVSDVQELGMKHLNFSIDFKPVALNAAGSDDVDFLFSFNKNQELMPVKDTASGGEISRLMLCIKAIIARSMKLPTIIFDEVDTGVSGDIANRIGGVMKDMSKHLQVLSITHLPQVAAHAGHHLMVYKEDSPHSTLTRVKKLTSHEHVLEVARMLSGENINEASINNAKSLIENCK